VNFKAAPVKNLIAWSIVAVSSCVEAGIANPLIAPPPAVKVEQEKVTPTYPGPIPTGTPGSVQVPSLVPGAAVAMPSQNTAQGQYGNQIGGTALEFPPEKWLAQAVVTSTVGDRATILVPLSLNEAQAANTNQLNSFNNPTGVQYGNPAQSGRNPAFGNFNQAQPGMGASQGGSGTNQPQMAIQQTRQEVLTVRTGVPFFFKSERFSVDVSGREVTIWRPGKVQGSKDLSARDSRDIIFVGSVSSTEMLRRAVISTFAPSDPAVLKRVTPTYGGTSSTAGSSQQGGSSANPGDPNTGATK
jgi:hypothetical protein